MKRFCAVLVHAIMCALLSFSASGQAVTPNAGLQVPAYSQINWQVPIIYDLTRLDNIFGGSVAVPLITLSGPITNASQAATKAYVDSVAQGFLQASGATMNGPLVLSGDPTAPLQAATKQYVDAHAGTGGMVYPNPGISVSTGDGWDNSLAVPAGDLVGTTATQNLSNKTVDGVTSTVFGYLDATSSIQGQLNNKAPITSPAFTGTPTAPTAALDINNTQIATTAYVQQLVSSNFLSAAGGTLNSGANLTLGDGSSAASQAYVATAISGISGGGSLPTANQANQAPISTGAGTNYTAQTLANVAFSGNYNDLSNTPTIPAPQVNADWNATSGIAQILNKPSLSFLSLTGGTLSGLLNLSDGSPAASQQYVQNTISGSQQQIVAQEVTSAVTPGKICATQAGINGSVVCGGVTGVPVAITTQYGLNTPILNTVGATNSVSQLGLTINSSANTQVLWPTTIGNYDQATTFKREQWFTAGSNLPGLDNYEVDTYQFDHADQWMFMFGWQCNAHNTGFWQYDNFKSGWHNTSVACSIVQGHTYHWILNMHRDPISSTACTLNGSSVPCLHWDTFQLDDVTAATSTTYTLNSTYPAESVAYLQSQGSDMSTWDGVGSQVQIDVVDSSANSSNPQLVSMYIDDDTVTAYGTSANLYLPLSGGTLNGNLNAPTFNNAQLSKDTNGNVTVGGSLQSGVNTGTNNTDTGNGALYSNTSGSNNDAFGLNALQDNTTGVDNDAFGVGALGVNTTGHDNTAHGKSALSQNTTGAGNTAVGSFAGYNSGTPLQTGSDNTYIGDGANATADALTNCSALGYNAQCTLSNEMVFGNSSVSKNVFHGDLAAGTFNSAPMSRFGSGNNNVGGSMQASATGSNNTASGSGALFNLTTGTSNSAFGLNALQALTSAGSDDAFGVGALSATTTGGSNTATGHNALGQNTTGSGNTAVGPSAGYNTTTPMQTGTNNTYIGQGANASADGFTNDVVIGYDAQATASNQIIIGNSSITQACFAGGRMCWYSSSGIPSTSLCTSSNIGSLYSNTNGGATATLYVCTAAGTWTAK